MAGLKFLNVKLINRMKKLILKISEYKLVFISVVFLVIFSVGCGKKEKIKIGAILPLTGDNGTYGVLLKRGMDLAVDEINSHGGVNGKKLIVIFEDSQADPSKAVSAFNKLVTVDKVPMIIGDMFSSSTLAIAPIAEKNKIVLMSPTASAIDLTNAGDYIFRIYPSDSYDGMYLANFSWNRLQIKSISIIYLQVASISALTQVFKERFELLGGKILSVESYKEGDTDFRSLLLKAKNTEPDIIFIPGYLREMAILLRQAKELGIKKPFLSISTFFDPKILKLAGDAAEGVLFSSPSFDPSSNLPEIKNFVNMFKAKYNEIPNILAGYGYDVVNITFAALKSINNVTPDNIKAALYNINNYPGVTGKTAFDSNGDVVKELKMMQVENVNFTSLN